MTFPPARRPYIPHIIRAHSLSGGPGCNRIPKPHPLTRPEKSHFCAEHVCHRANDEDTILDITSNGGPLDESESRNGQERTFQREFLARSVFVFSQAFPPKRLLECLPRPRGASRFFQGLGVTRGIFVNRFSTSFLAKRFRGI